MRKSPFRAGSALPVFEFIVAVVLLAGCLGNARSQAAPIEQPRTRQEIEMFVSAGCPHCLAAEAFVHELVRVRSDLDVTVVDVRDDPGAAARLRELWRSAGIEWPGVPTIRIGTELIVGFDTPETTGAQILAVLERTVPATATGGAGVCGVADENKCATPPDDSLGIPFSDRRLGVADVGLPLFTIIMGLLDGFNPCSMWVLILMISMLAALRDRRKMLVIAGTFVAVEGICYFAFMAAWLNLFLLVGISRPSEIAIALLAIVAGMLNLKDFVAPGRGITLSIPIVARPGIYARLRAVLLADRIWPALVGAAVLAVLMQIVELLCTSGFPAIYTRILTLRHFDRAVYYGYLLLYNLMYMLDDIVVLAIGVVTLSQRRLQEKEGRWLKLIAGFVMVGLGIYLLVPR